VVRFLRGLVVALVTAAVSVVVPAVAQAQPASRPGLAPSGFTPSSTSWTTDRRGWMLGFTPCPSGQCPALLHTFDGGARWWPAGTPPVRLSPRNFQVRVFFADDTVGLVTDGERLYTTHTAGLLWQQVRLPGAGASVTIGALAADDQALYAIVDNDASTRLYSSPLRVTRWRPVPGVALPDPGEPGGGGDVVARGHTAYVVLDDLFVADGYWVNTGGAWRPAQPPCDVDAVPDLGLASDGALYALCSYDPGMGFMFKDLEKPNPGGGFTFVSSAPDNGITTAFSAASADTVAVGAIGRGAAFVHRGTGGGTEWQTPLVLDGVPISDLTFTDATHGFLMWGGPQWSEAAVYRTSDAGATWTPIA
jgi:hypothetical protein